MAELAPGVVVAGCRIEAVVGRGGMGVVYRATQLSLNRQIALKAIAPELASDVTFRERFKRESQIAASIEHPNVIPVYEAGEGEGMLYLTMRYVEGTDLRALIATEGGLDPARAARIVGQMAAALAAAHRRGLVHRDVKPANVLVAAGDEHAYLTDFGIARHIAATSGLTRTGAVVGTIDYLAPERIQDGSGDAGADVYGLGCVLFESLTGSVPFPRDNDVAKMYAHLNAPTPAATDLVPDVPKGLAELAERAMAKDPSDRFESAGEMAALLLEAAAGEERAEAAHAPGLAETNEVAQAPATPSPRDAPAATEPATTQPLAVTPRPLPASPPTAVEPAATRAQAVTPPPPAESEESSGPSRLALFLGIGAAAAAIAVLLVLLLGGGGDDGEPGIVNVGTGADGVAVGFGYVWVANEQDDRVVRVDPNTKQTKEIPVGENPDSLAIDTGRGLVWVTNTDDGTVDRITPAGKVSGKAIKVGKAPEGITVGRGAVWVANGGDGTVTRLNERLEPTTTEVGEGPVQLAIAGNRVWVTLSEGRKVVPLDADTGKPAGEPVVLDGARLRGIAYGNRYLWVALPDRNRVYRFDPKRPRRRAPVVVEQDPREVRYGEGAVWISHGKRGVVTSVDPATLNKSDPVEVGPDAYGLGIGGGLVWAASQGNGDLVPIDPRPE